MKKRVLLINPPFYRLMGSHFNGLTLGLSYISSVLKENGFQTRIYNADFLDKGGYPDQAEIFHNYDEYKRTINDPEGGIWKEMRRAIEAYSPDIVGISMHTGTYKSARNAAEITKDISGDTKVVVGGPHATLDPDGVILNNPAIDYAVRGEGEYTFLDLALDKEREGISGISYRGRNGVVHNPDRPFMEDLDGLPLPDRGSVNDAEKHDLASIITGRGCPFTCSYCASPKLWKGQTRSRSIDNVLKEILEVRKLNGKGILYFVDDTFSLDLGRAKELCRRITREGIDIKWKCDTRIDLVDAELASLMKAAGCVRVKMGVESGSDRILKEIGKGIGTEEIRRGVRLMKDAGIPITIYLMAGFPGETNKDLSETIKFAEELDVDYYSVSVLAPYYGTRMYQELEKNGRTFDKDHWEYFFHQSREMALNDGIDESLLEEFFRLNERNGGKVRA